MGIIRLAAIVAVGVALLPTDREKQAELYDRAASTAKWTVTFCERNGETCAQASSVWDQFLKKAEFGAKLAYDVLSENKGAATDTAANTSLPADDAASAMPALVSSRTGTLTSRDLSPKWRGKVSEKKGI